MAQAAGIAPKDVNYVPFDGGGELLASILGDKVAFGVSGVGEYLDQIKAGELRLLAVTGPKRVAGPRRADPHGGRAGRRRSPTGAASSPRPASPTPSATSSSRLVERAARLPAVAGVAEDATAGTTPSCTGEEFGDFLDAQDKRVDTVLKELGL